MKDNSLYKLGGICSVLVGISYLVIGVTELLLPPVLTGEPNVRIPLMFYKSNEALLIAQYAAMAWGAVFALAVIPAVSEKVRNLNEGWVRWTSTLAMLGFAVTIIDNYVAIVVTGPVAAAYQVGSEATRAAIMVPFSAHQMDLRGWLQWAAPGLWVLVVNLIALRGNVWPKLLAYLGFAAALGYFLTFGTAALLALSSMTLVVAAIGGVVIGPIWYAWMGLILYHTNSQREVRESNSPSVGVNSATL